MKKLFIALLALLSFAADAQFVGGGGRGVKMGGGGGGGSDYVLTSNKITVALGYHPANPADLTKTFFELDSVENIPPLHMPISNAVAAALALKLNAANLATINGQSLNNGGANIAITESDPSVGAHVKAITTTNISNWGTAYTNQHTHSNKTDIDGITAGLITNWSTAFGWGNHAGLYVPVARTITAGTGLTGGGSLSANRTLTVSYGTTAGTAAQGNDTRIVNGSTAFDWGNHALAGYLTSGAATAAYQSLSNLSTNLDASATKYPNVNAVNTGLALKANIAGIASINGQSLYNGGENIVISGSGTPDLTNATGTLADARLTSNVVLANGAAFTGKASLSGTQTFTASNTFSSTQRFTATWANKPLIVGVTGNSGVIAFARGSDGSNQALVGYKSSGENNAFAITNPSGSGTVEFGTVGGTALKIFNDARVVVQRGGTLTNSGKHDFHVNGTASVSSYASIGGGLTLNPDSIKTFSDNDEAIAGGLPPGKLYKSEADNGDWVVKMTRPMVEPVFSEKVSSGSTRLLWAGTSFEQSYKAQSPNLNHNLQRAANKTNPVYRFEIRRFENWATDSVNNNTQNGQYKERTEMYAEGMSIPFDVDVWVSYSIYIEPGADITYGGNTNYYCMLGQWHPGDGVASGGPSWGIELLGQGNLNLFTRGQEDLVPPFTGGRPYLVDQANVNVTRGEWHNMVFRVRQNKNTLAGQIEWWLDGNPVTLVSGGAAAIGNDYSTIGYWKFGIYRTSNANTLAVRYANMAVLVDPTNSNTVNPGTLKGRIDHPLPIN